MNSSGAGAPEKLRVAVVTPYFPIAGSPYRGHSTYQTLLRLAHLAEVDVISPIATYPQWFQPSSYSYRPAAASYSPPGVRARYRSYSAVPLLTRPFNGWYCSRVIRNDLRDLRPDVVLNYWLYPEGYAAVRAGRHLGVPVVVCAIGSDLLRIPDPVTNYFTRQTLRQADFVLGVSRELCRQAISLGAHPARVRAILNGCDTAVFHPGDRLQSRRSLGVKPDAQLVLYVGSLLSTKGLGELVDAAAALAGTHPRLQVVCAGEGGFRMELEHRISAAGLTGRFLLTGTLDSATVASWMIASDVFCLPSYSEGCPNVVVEALACGRPVVSTMVGGIPELVDDASGLLVPPRAAGPLAAALAQALDRSWSESAIVSRSTRSWDDVAEETLEALTAAIDHHRLERPRPG